MPISIRRNDRNGNAALDRSSRTSPCSSARACGPATDRPVYSIAHGRTETPFRRQMPLEPAQVVDLRRVGADQEDALLRDAAHREVADQLAALVEHRRQRDAPDLRDAVRHDVRQPLRGTRAA